MISRKDVEHIARLCRIELSEAEKAKFENELSAILDFVAKLSGVDTTRIEPLAGGTELASVMREDETGKHEVGSMNQGLVEAAPRKRDGYVEVPQVFDRES